MSLARQVPTWASRIGLWRKITIALAIAAPACGIATYLLLTGPQPVGAHPALVLPMLYLDLTLLLALAALVVKRLVEVWAERRRGLAGSRMQIKLVGLFSLIAIIPTIIVAVFSYLFFSFGVEAWFSDRVRTAISESVAVADAYVREHQQAIRADALSMASDLNHNASALSLNPQYLAPVLTAQAAMRGLTEAAIVDGNGKMLERTGLAFALGFEDVGKDAIKRAALGDVVIMTDDQDERVRALVRLDEFSNLYLYVGRFIEPRVLKHRDETHLAAAQYEQLEGQRSGIQITFAVVFILVAMLFLAAAVSIGINFAAQLTDPISRLVSATEQVSAGDLTTRVPEGKKDDELASLSRAFNRMTNQLQSQQREVIEANRQLDERRRFTETVLTGVSAGVIGLDRSGRINLPNRSASSLLGVDLDVSIGEDLAEIAPEMADLLDEAARRPERLAQGQVQIAGTNSTRTLLVRIAAERDGGDISGFVVTFDDITELLSAQRKAAWADIARRIAHEIKNPLTPIQLGRTPPAELSQRDQEGAGNLPHLHRYDRAACRGYRADGRRVLGLCADAGAGPQARGFGDDRRARRIPATGRPSRDRLLDPLRLARDGAALRRAPGGPGGHQHRQERDRIDRGSGRRGCGGKAPGGARRDRRGDRRDRQPACRCRRGQRERAAEARPRTVDRAICHDPRERHRVGPRHRQEDHGRSPGRAGPRGSGASGSSGQPCVPARGSRRAASRPVNTAG